MSTVPQNRWSRGSVQLGHGNTECPPQAVRGVNMRFWEHACTRDSVRWFGYGGGFMPTRARARALRALASPEAHFLLCMVGLVRGVGCTIRGSVRLSSDPCVSHFGTVGASHRTPFTLHKLSYA